MNKDNINEKDSPEEFSLIESVADKIMFRYKLEKFINKQREAKERKTIEEREKRKKEKEKLKEEFKRKRNNKK